MSAPLRILSLGAGVQSTAIALMSVDGHLPKLDCAIFADTGWEPRAVYEHLDRLTYIRRVDPLIDILDLDREACGLYLQDRWPWPVERSACIGCPFHDNREWRHLRDEAPDEFADAVEFDLQIRSKPLGGFKAEAYLHSDRVPLGEANLNKIGRRENLAAQGRLFPGCNPFDCERSFS